MLNFKLRRYGPKKNWYVFWTENGRSERWSTRTQDHGLAKKRQKAFVQDLLSKEDAADGEVSIALALRQYFDEKAVGTADEKNVGQAVDNLLAFYGEDMKVRDLTPSTNIAYEKHCRTKLKHLTSTINRRRNVLIAALNHAKKNGMLQVVPHVPMLATPPRKERYLSRDEAARMIRLARRWRLWHLVLFIRIGLATGARHTAILQLTWDRIDLETGRIDFRLPGEVETKKRRPHAPIDFALLRALRAVRKKNPKGKFVIAFNGRPIGLIRKSFLKVARELGLKKVSPHTLKHTAITWMLHDRLTPWQVSGITATSVATILRVYGHHVQDDLREAVNEGRRNARRLRRDAQNARNKDFLKAA
jgi:integrase